MVTCFHEFERALSKWPEGVRRHIKASLDKVNCPEIINGHPSFWQWDCWFFCAGYRSSFTSATDCTLVRNAQAMDSIQLPPNMVGRFLPTKVSRVAGQQALGCIGLAEQSTDAVNPTPTPILPVFHEELVGGADGIFSITSVLYPPQSDTPDEEKLSLIRGSAEIHLSMRKRVDQPISSLETPVMIFGPAFGHNHPLKRGNGSGVQHINSDDLESYQDVESTIIIGVEYCRPNGQVILLKYQIRPKSLGLLSKRHAAHCVDLSRAKTAWSKYVQTPSRFLHLGNSCDEPFTSEYCVISGINPTYLKDPNHDGFIAKIRRAARGKKLEARPSEEWLSGIRTKKHRHLKLSSLGWSLTPREKVFIVV